MYPTIQSSNMAIVITHITHIEAFVYPKLDTRIFEVIVFLKQNMSWWNAALLHEILTGVYNDLLNKMYKNNIEEAEEFKEFYLDSDF